MSITSIGILASKSLPRNNACALNVYLSGFSIAGILR
jgi:hypothetical protein